MSRASRQALSPGPDLEDVRIARLFAVARLLYASLREGMVITRPALRDRMMDIFGISDAWGD